MSEHSTLGLIDVSESPEVHPASRSPRPESPTMPTEHQMALLALQRCKRNANSLASRFSQLVRGPADLAPLIFSIYSLFLSFFSSGRQPGVDFLYPTSLTRRESSGRLARLILDHSKHLQKPNLRKATVVEQGFDPPRVAVIDLDEVPRDVIERGYSVPADMHGFLILFMILVTLFALYAYILSPIDAVHKNVVGLLVKRWFGERTWVLCANWILPCLVVGVLLHHAIVDGDGILTLVQRSGPVVSGYAVFLDHEFTLILSGGQSTVEAITESGFSITPLALFKFLKETFPYVPFLLYEMLKASCNGFFLTFFFGSCLAFRPSLITASVLLAPTIIIAGIWTWAQVQKIRGFNEDLVPIYLAVFGCVMQPSWFLFSLAAGEHYLLEGMLEFVPQWPVAIALVPFAIFVFWEQDFPIHTTKFLDVIGNPPIRRWEFDTLAAVATFQCLVLCRGIISPIKTTDALALLDIFIPDQTDVWMAWKRRVADRIMYEAEISFTPTIPTFGDERQERLKKLLDQAQIGYDVYKDFYGWYALEPLL